MWVHQRMQSLQISCLSPSTLEHRTKFQIANSRQNIHSNALPSTRLWLKFTEFTSLADSVETIRDTTKMHRTVFVARKMSYKKVPHGLPLSPILCPVERLETSLVFETEASLLPTALGPKYHRQTIFSRDFSLGNFIIYKIGPIHFDDFFNRFDRTSIQSSRPSFISWRSIENSHGNFPLVILYRNKSYGHEHRHSRPPCSHVRIHSTYSALLHSLFIPDFRRTWQNYELCNEFAKRAIFSSYFNVLSF